MAKETVGMIAYCPRCKAMKQCCKVGKRLTKRGEVRDLQCMTCRKWPINVVISNLDVAATTG